jgi:predicted peptidase
MKYRFLKFILIGLPIFVFVASILEGCTSTSTTMKYQNPPLSPAPGQHSYSLMIGPTAANQLKEPVQINFLLYLPESYGKDPLKKWPLTLFLHGMGERGNDLELLKIHPLPKTLELQKDFPSIVVSPQLPLDKRLWDDFINPLKTLLDQFRSTYAVDSQRVYITGLSMGGAGTWNFVLRYPHYFAAAVPIAGAYKFRSKELPENICGIKNLPIWAFHGAKDKSVEAWQTEILVDTLRTCGSTLQFTLYPEADHVQSWILAYADPELYAWLLSQTLK